MKLTREQIVRAALRVLDEVGLDGLTLRRIATELGVQAPALYWYVRNKSQLLDELATTMLDDAFADIDPSAPYRHWREELRAAADFLRSMMLAHRDGAQVVSGTYYSGHAFALSPEERFLPLLQAEGFDAETAMDVMMSLYHYTVGFVIEEQEVFPVPGEPDARYELEALRAKNPGRDPAVLDHLFAAESTTKRFHSGIELLIDGAQARLERCAAQRPGSSAFI